MLILIFLGYCFVLYYFVVFFFFNEYYLLTSSSHELQGSTLNDSR